MATIPKAAKSRQSLQHGQLGLFGVIMPGVAQVAPAFNLFFTTGLMVGLAGASAPLIFLISMVGMVATASSLAQFASIYPSAGSFITYITRAIGTKVAVAVGVITILGYIIAFGGIYIFVGSYIAQNVFGNPHIWGLTQMITIAYGVLVVAPVILGLRFGVRVTVALYAFEVILRVRGAQHRDRRDLDRVHQPGHRVGFPVHVRDPRAGDHVPGRQRGPHRGVGPAAPPRCPQERRAAAPARRQPRCPAVLRAVVWALTVSYALF
jgi:hypothetical protein